jgi:hypothetical protein
VHVVLDHPIRVLVLPGDAAELRLDVRPKVHPRPVPPAEERLAGSVLALDELDGAGDRLVVHRLHPLLRKRPRIFDALGAILVGP